MTVTTSSCLVIEHNGQPPNAMMNESAIYLPQLAVILERPEGAKNPTSLDVGAAERRASSHGRFFFAIRSSESSMPHLRGAPQRMKIDFHGNDSVVVAPNCFLP